MSTQAACPTGSPASWRCQSFPPAKPVPTLLEDVRKGLREPPRTLPPKYFYDARGSELFDRICDTEEYYPTRVESGLLRRSADALIDTARPGYLIELGSGTSRKTRHLLDACSQFSMNPEYWPMDVCEPMLVETAGALTAEYPWLSVNAFVGDYHGGFEYFPRPPGRALYVFLGGTIGNFGHAEAVSLLADLRRRMDAGDHLLLGFDRVKDPAVLEAAYNDARGVTAAFNLNVLEVLNRELQADFPPERFSHQAQYNGKEQRIEMYLVADSDQAVRVGALGEVLDIAAGERILTEISRKFTPASIEQLLGAAGFELVEHHAAERDFYSLVLARPAV